MIGQHTHKGKWFLAGLMAAALVVLFCYIKCKEEPLVALETTNEGKILISPEEIRDIEEIGQWVFLNIETEEMVDTVRKHLITSDDALSRIYTGTLHFGLNMEKLKGSDWFFTSGDTARIYLPAIELMDENFINEAKTRTFYQEGDWDATAMKALYNKAKDLMKERCVTEKNLKTAQDNAEQEITSFIKSFGFKEVELAFTNY